MPGELGNSGHYAIRPITAADEACLWEMLYQAVYVPPGQPPLSRDILKQPEIACYVQGWGRPGDLGLVAVDRGDQVPLAAAWLRLWTGEYKGFGYVDETTPELSIAVLPPYRGRGIGTALLAHLIKAAQPRYPAISLSVDPDNPVLRLYRRLGFEVVGEHGSSLTMIKRWGRS
jgi:ribosomal protein S18 acetylase RimI-like enzyme